MNIKRFNSSVLHAEKYTELSGIKHAEKRKLKSTGVWRYQFFYKAVTKKDRLLIQACEMWYLKIVMGVKRAGRVMNSRITKSPNVHHINTILDYFHNLQKMYVNWMKNHRIPKLVNSCEPLGRRPLVRPGMKRRNRSPDLILLRYEQEDDNHYALFQLDKNFMNYCNLSYSMIPNSITNICVLWM